ncbi:MAG: hypothetical protein ACI81R_003744 [Bradymonadia bacterium]|jgi:hypothetical protein
MRRRTFLSGGVAPARPLAVTVCDAGGAVSPDTATRPAPSYTQSADWAPLQAEDMQPVLAGQGNSIDATSLSDGSR